MAGRSKYDWNLIRSEYIQGYFLPNPNYPGGRQHVLPTLDQLAARHGCNEGTLKHKAADEFWTKRKEAFQSRLSDSITSQQVNTFLSESAQFDAMTLNKLHKMHKLLDTFFDQYENLYDEDATTVLQQDDVLPQLSDMKTAMDILDKCQSLVRRTVGEPVAPDATLYNNLHKIFSETSTLEYDSKGSLTKIEGSPEEALKVLDERSEVRSTMIEDLKKELKELKSSINKL